ncbi:DUF4352 domain-containing protein [Schumannella soli]|uniref:DUF4352 domain-containing protein n=1 Tax=Schumannella soli TaxID=2590779 RepID=A0A506Y1Z5_9MICO|nr:DUF4352 domain-containing protein [Schumannella soli]TPW76055.1 DUF4352 domain-containing protein [Schumannella soli]
MARDRGRLIRRAVIGGIAGVIVVAALAIVVSGGLADDGGRRVTTYRVGERIESGNARTVVESVTLSTRRPGSGFEASDGRRWLVITVVQTNLSDAPLFVTNLRIGINYGTALDQRDTTRSIDRAAGGQAASPLPPGVPTRLWYVFDVPATAAPDDETVVGVYRADRTYGDPVFGDTGYGSPYPVGRVPVDRVEDEG